MSTKVTFIDPLSSLIPLLDSLEDLPADPPSWYFDLEGEILAVMVIFPF
jgi:hypothetical protein